MSNETIPKPNGALLIELERRRQVEQEGWSADHDDGHVRFELSRAANSYVLNAAAQVRGPADLASDVPEWWPWGPEAWRPDTPIRNLVKAGALLAAEIDRLLRLEEAEPPGPHAMRLLLIEIRWQEYKMPDLSYRFRCACCLQDREEGCEDDCRLSALFDRRTGKRCPGGPEDAGPDERVHDLRWRRICGCRAREDWRSSMSEYIDGFRAAQKAAADLCGPVHTNPEPCTCGACKHLALRKSQILDLRPVNAPPVEDPVVEQGVRKCIECGATYEPDHEGAECPHDLLPLAPEDLNWVDAEANLVQVEKNYGELIGQPGVNVSSALGHVIDPARRRFDSGERTAELHKLLMGLE